MMKSEKIFFEKTVKMVEQINYEGAGTVDLYEDGKFYFFRNEY